MARQCNIDQRGRALRARIGVVLCGLGVLALLAWTLPFDSRVGWGVTLLLLAAGVFSLVEAWLGWCVVRAMGFRTRF